MSITLVPKLLFGNAGFETPFRVGFRNRVSRECVPKQEFGNEGDTANPSVGGLEGGKAPACIAMRSIAGREGTEWGPWHEL